MILRHHINQLVKEKELITLSDLAHRLKTSESHVLVEIQQMIDTGSNIRLVDGNVYFTRKGNALAYLLSIGMFAMIVFVPAVLDLN